MRDIPQSMKDIWTGGDYTGDRRPFARITLQRVSLQNSKPDAKKLFTTAIFGQVEAPVELPNIKSIEWDRSLGADVAECTIVLYNTAPLPLGESPSNVGDLDLPGVYTYNYGTTEWSTSRWGHEPSKWQELLMPDRVIRTYEGYGYDPTKPPEEDPHLVQTGMWLIDDIEFSTDGLITVTCRDMGRLLLDQMCFPPVIPLDNYPLEWEATHQVPGPPKVVNRGYTYRPTYSRDSNIPYVGKNGLVHGHRPTHAFDKADKTFWMSIGNDRPSAGYAFEHIEGSCSGRTVQTVTYKVWGGPYRVYLSIKVKGKWLGRSTIPYNRHLAPAAPNGSDIKYSSTMTVAREGTATFSLPKPIANVDAVRLTFTNLYNSGIGPYKYRAGVRDIVCSTAKATTEATTKTVGNYDDYTDIVKYLLASGGFHWPKAWISFFTYSDGTRHTLIPETNDPVLVSGRVWGDLENTGTKAEVDPLGNVGVIGTDIFDKKPLMDGIAYVRDLVGYVFYIDETGGAVFRQPNVYVIGNWIGLVSAKSGRVPDVITIDERQTLIGLRAKISSRNLRDAVFVANSTGEFGAIAVGYDPSPRGSKVGHWSPGFRRIGGWTDMHFLSKAEAQRMADFIVIRQAWTFRQNTLTIAANPAIQIDDQVRIYERISNEGYLHYVTGIRSSHDMEEGRWTYDLTTNWLGENPFDYWVFDPGTLSSLTKQLIDAIVLNVKSKEEETASGGGPYQPMGNG